MALVFATTSSAPAVAASADEVAEVMSLASSHLGTAGGIGSLHQVDAVNFQRSCCTFTATAKDACAAAVNGLHRSALASKCDEEGLGPCALAGDTVDQGADTDSLCDISEDSRSASVPPLDILGRCRSACSVYFAKGGCGKGDACESCHMDCYKCQTAVQHREFTRHFDRCPSWTHFSDGSSECGECDEGFLDERRGVCSMDDESPMCTMQDSASIEFQSADHSASTMTPAGPGRLSRDPWGASSEEDSCFQCTPCVFFAMGRCAKGDDCEFCHLTCLSCQTAIQTERLRALQEEGNSFAEPIMRGYVFYTPGLSELSSD